METISVPPGSIYTVGKRDGHLFILHHECRMTSWNLNDVLDLYCGHCHRFLMDGIAQMTEAEVRAFIESIRTRGFNPSL